MPEVFIKHFASQRQVFVLAQALGYKWLDAWPAWLNQLFTSAETDLTLQQIRRQCELREVK